MEIKRVLLPEPLAPMRVMSYPLRTEMLTPLMAMIRP